MEKCFKINNYTNILKVDKPEIFGLKFCDLSVWLKNLKGRYFYNIWIRTDSISEDVINLAKTVDNFYILFNDSLEGYAYITFKKIYKLVEQHDLQNKVIFVSGHLDAENEYNSWLNNTKNKKAFYVVSNNQWFERIRSQCLEEKIKIPLVKTEWFCCLNHRAHKHRIETLDYIEKINLKKYGSVTALWKNEVIDNTQNVCLPHSYIEPHYNSLINITTETYYYNCWNFNNEMFLSEKTWKPIVSKQIFVFIGPKGILKKLKELGFKTFENFIDESYDELPDEKRLYAALDSVKSATNNFTFNKLEKETRQIRNFNLNLLKKGVFNTPIWKVLDES